MQLLLDVWREACRHIEIEESVERVARLVADRIPADLILVRRIDLERSRIETVAVGLCRDGPLPSRTRTECTAGQMQMLLRWASEGRLRLGRSGDGDPLLAIVAPPDPPGELLAGPLMAENGPAGVLVLIARPPRRFAEEHVSTVRDLLDPFSIALTNDARLQELARLRDALEADKQALLSRLDRQEVADEIVGSDSGMRAVMQRVEQVAPTDVPVLIFGETGTGKEVVARALHTRSRRATGPVVRVNCGSLPPGLVDSELFGHERGSFTGAVATRRGWFERADGGTLFLDEVGELPLDAQVRLLRILQDGTFERVGGQRPLTVDVRIVAATHRDLQDMVARGTFREDLWYRLGVFPIRIPPLRERIEDIPALAAHFAWRVGNRLGGGPLTLTPTDVGLLVAYSWPGNVRELASVIERAAILGDGRSLHILAALGGSGSPLAPAMASGPSATPASPWTSAAARAPVNPGAPTPAPEDEGPMPLERVMARHIEEALRKSHGRIEGVHGAAVRLGINPHTLRARMRKLGIDWARFRNAGGKG